MGERSEGPPMLLQQGGIMVRGQQVEVPAL